MIQPKEARRVLRLLGAEIAPPTDYHTLGASVVDALCDLADTYRYRKPRNANGSRARYFFAHLMRRARADAGEPV